MSELAVFGYGSLMYQPELPDQVLERVPARLPGHHRAFNKRSPVRGCKAHQARWTAITGVPQAFHPPGKRHSLALGTEKHSGSELHGMLLVYPSECAARVVDAHDAREGYREHWTASQNSYRRCTVEVLTADGPREALAYLGEPQSALYSPLPLETVARVLLAATPQPGGKARGVDYLFEARDILARVGLIDPHIESIVSELLALPGPWSAHVQARAVGPTNS